jgi:MFS family permease
VLPLLGGSAAVWAACLVFFQSALLLGYLVAHWLVTRAGTRAQAVVFAGMLALSIAQLAFAIDPGLSADAAHPIASVLWVLTALIGLPFVTLSAASPLLQAWYARSARAQDDVDMGADGVPTVLPTAQPYRLFAVSNVGSLLALLIYPWLIEPRLSLHDQTAALAAAFALLIGVCAVIGYSMWRAPTLPAPTLPTRDSASRRDADDSLGRRTLWVALAACGSLLLSAVTTHLSQNVAAIPLLWIIPLVLYLLSFVVAFSSELSRPAPRAVLMGLAAVGLAGAAYYQYKGDYYAPIVRVVATYSGALFLICLFCHAELYARRPAPARLTTFYLCVAAGGALGAVLVGVVAPTVLTGMYELVAGLCLAAILAFVVTWQTGWLSRVAWAAVAGLMVALLIRHVKARGDNNLVHVRNFYGTLRVSQDSDRVYHAYVRTLFNGIIEHGQQVFRVDLGAEPTTYYGRSSGVGLALAHCCGERPRRVGVIGLGTGTVAAYGRPGDVFRFYDINPAVEPIARHYFTYLRNSPARIEIATGDARVSLAREAPQRFDVLVVDAFTGDAIPVHLLTTQALALYRRHLQPRGIVAFHVSNHFLDLAPVVQQLAEHDGLKTAFIESRGDRAYDLDASDWVLVTADADVLMQAPIASAQEAITIPRGLRRWTDDYNSLLPILRKR